MEKQEKRIFSFKGMQVTLRKAAYRFGNTLAVIMDEVESGDEYGTITVNLSHDIQDGYAAFVDTNNIPGIDTWLEEQGDSQEHRHPRQERLLHIPAYALRHRQVLIPYSTYRH